MTPCFHFKDIDMKGKIPLFAIRKCYYLASIVTSITMFNFTTITI